MSNFRKISATAGEVQYANPADVTHTCRVGVVRSPKTAGSVSLTNVRAEMVEAIRPVVSDGTNTGVENLSIRIVVSGSTKNKALLRAAVARTFTNYLACMDDGLSDGFVPEISLVAAS